MKRQVSLYEAKTHLSQLVEDAARGDVIIIAKNGKPKAQIVVVDAENDAKSGKRVLGQWADLMTPEERAYYRSDQFLRDWKAMDAEIERDFEESINRPIDQPIEPFDTPRRVAEPSREFQWDDTSSTRAPSSARKKAPRPSGRKRAK